MASQELLSTLLLSNPNLRDFFVPVHITQALKADRFLISSLKHDMMNTAVHFTARARGEYYKKGQSCTMGYYLAGLAFCMGRNRGLLMV